MFILSDEIGLTPICPFILQGSKSFLLCPCVRCRVQVTVVLKCPFARMCASFLNPFLKGSPNMEWALTPGTPLDPPGMGYPRMGSAMGKQSRQHPV